jgi:hypothetical protein
VSVRITSASTTHMLGEFAEVLSEPTHRTRIAVASA